MIKPTQKLKCKEDKLQITKDVLDKDIELTLELEMDEEVKEIINCPEKYGDAMLDVTVIKPKLDKLYSAQRKVMSGDEVKKFIAAMSSARPTQITNQQIPKQDSSKSNDATFGTATSSTKPKSPLHKFAPPSPRITSNRTEGSSSEMDKDKVRQIFTAASKSFKDLNALFECKNKIRRDENLKPETPCSCKNCSIVGIVADSQKKPFANETAFDPSSPKREAKEEDYNKRKKATTKEDNHVQCQYYFKHLSDKIKSLETRITVQEERSVAKDYFKRIITKVINHISKVTGYPSQVRMEVPCSTKCKKESPCDKYDHYNRKYVVNHMNIDKEKQSNNEEPSTSTGTFWKWGEDVLKPGIELKNKIIKIIEDTLGNLKKSKNKPRDDEIKQFVDEFAAHLYKTVNEVCQRSDMNRMMDLRDKKMKNLARTHWRNPEEQVSVKYINSKILKWKETETTFKLESDKESVKNASTYDQKQLQDMYKLEFMKTLKNTKEEDKLKLWRSIWNQAIKNRQDKNDKVTIQIPDRRDPKRKQVEIIYTLGDLEYLLLGEKSRDR